MREPKTFKHPRLYWRPEFDDSDGTSPVCELVIIYPKKREVDYLDCFSERPGMANYMFNGEGLECCWELEETILSPHQAVMKMKTFAKQRGHKTVFLGEIK